MGKRENTANQIFFPFSNNLLNPVTEIMFHFATFKLSGNYFNFDLRVLLPF